jgi:hypothetical protein
MLMVVSVTGHTAARTFANAYVSFEVPDSWECHLEQTEWVCEETDVKTPHSSIMILAAKQIGPGDSMDAYYDHLTQVRTVRDTDGKPLRLSKVLSVGRVQIGRNEWVDSLQFESEIPSFYTRYLATVAGHIAVLVTFSAHRSVYSQAAARFSVTVNSIQVFDPLR